MAGQQRKCANCRFFNDAGMPGNGWCTHPKRQLNSGVKLLVRAGELACRNTWGGDLFQSRLEGVDAPVAAADLPGSDGDDEVTSVTIPSNRPSPAEDRVVRDLPAPRRREPADSNDAAHKDQEERARIMARGNRDAVAQALQRYSTRRQPGEGASVVADDDTTIGGEHDRVVTRQERFSDRGFAAGMPALRTAPVPREELEQRGVTPQDRFETIPEIDPDFDMPGQRHRSEQAASAPEPAASAEAAPVFDDEPMSGDEQLTAYEHVLQRARRIRTSKQERLRPIRHADILTTRAAAVPALHDDPFEPLDDHTTEDWYEEPAETRSPDAVAHAAEADDATWDEAGAIPTDDWAAAYDEEAPGGSIEAGTDAALAATWDDEDDAWDDEAVDDYVAPEPRRSGWLSRFGLRQRHAEPLYDDATITRHAEAIDAWTDDEPLDEPQDWRDVEPEPAPAWSQLQDELPAWRGPATPDVSHIEPIAATAPVPPPVPASERAGGAWDVASMPVRSATASRPRQRLDGDLPDLDDTLFDDDGDRGIPVARATVTHDAREFEGAASSASARDSFFRASRYPQREPSTPFADGPEQSLAGSEASLPDLEGGRLDLRDVVARGGELIDRRIEVAPDIPRQCRTCRSFRSADGGTRGWCTNEWAFTHRRMVNDDDLACVSAIGCWWMPADHLRLDLDDDLEEVRTPRMDELIAARRPAARRVAGE